MRVLVGLLALVVAITLPAAQPAAAAITAPYSALEAQPIAPGVRHERGSAAAGNGGVAVNVLEANLSTSGIGLVATAALDRANARELPTAQARRISREGHRVVATINGSTFASWPSPPYAARGLNVVDGELITAGHPRHGDVLTSFAVDGQGRPQIGGPTLDMTVTLADGTSVPLARFNQPRQAGEAVLFTPRFDATTPVASSGLEIVLGGIDRPFRTNGDWSGTVLELRPDVGSTPLAAGTVVISADSLAAPSFSAVQPGDQLAIELAIDPGWRDVQHAVGARELLVSNGQAAPWPLGGNTFSTSEPRTAVGITATGRLLMVAVDGRQTHSRGLTIPELAELMVSLGAVDAVNLDGGGSTVMAVRSPGQVESAIVNSPSSGYERTVANALHLVSSIPTGQLESLVVRPSTAAIDVGQGQQLSVAGHDAAYNGIPIDAGAVAWSTDSDHASIDATGLLTGLSAGDVTATASYSGLTASASIRVRGEAAAVGPSVPEGLTATAHDNFVIQLSWQASTSGVTGPIHYRVFRNSTAIGTQQLGLTYTDQRKAANTFTYQVRAIDAAGNKSSLSPPVTITAVQYAGASPTPSPAPTGSPAPTPSPTPTPTPASTPTPTPTTPSTAPTVPQGLTATAHDNFVIRLSWQASTASVPGTLRYRVFRNGSAIGTQQTTLTYTDQRKKVNTFSYQVRSIDAAGNKSALSAPVTVTSVASSGGSGSGGTPPPPGPSVPQGLTATVEPGFVVKLSWQPSISSVSGTIRYRVFRNDTAIGTQQAALTYTDQRKKVNTFTYRVRAIDAAGNKSSLSPPITVTTIP